jgi:hypothetical protein
MSSAGPSVPLKTGQQNNGANEKMRAITPKPLASTSVSASAGGAASKGPKLPSVNGLNWLLHLYFIRKDYKSCNDIINEQLKLTNGMCEYAIYIQGKTKLNFDLLESQIEFFFFLLSSINL